MTGKPPTKAEAAEESLGGAEPTTDRPAAGLSSTDAPTAQTMTRTPFAVEAPGAGPESPTERPNAIEPGVVINGRYRVSRLLGQGGMGAVYRVHDQLYPGRPTALKLFLHRVSHPVDLFREEFKTMASLRHPNVARVYDFGTVRGQEALFFTMELIAGATLSAVFLAEGADSLLKTSASDGTPQPEPAEPEADGSRLGVPWAEVVDLLVPVVRALSYLHTRGVVHYDLKPSNIMVSPRRTERQVKVLDFGLAGLRQSGGGRLMGTPLYLSPEIAQRTKGDHRADLYSLGIMAFQLLCGEVPYGTTQGFSRLLELKLNEPVRFPGRAEEAVPAWLRQVVEKLCAIEPGDRYPTASALLDALNREGGLSYELETQDTRESYLFSSRFVGRRRELGEILWAIDGCLEGRGDGGLFVTGKSGMGKSRLMREVRQAVQLKGVAFAEADCFERDLSESGPMASLVLQAVSLARSLKADDLLAEHGPEMVKLVPALAQDAGLAPTPALDNADAERRRMLEATAAFFVGLGGRVPYVLYVNDLQWAHDSTIDVIATLLRLLRGQAEGARSGLALLGSYRIDAADDRPIRRLVEPGKAASVQTLELLPLGEGEVVELLRSMLGTTALPAGLAPGVTRASAGLPFFVEEILRDLLEQGNLHFQGGAWTGDPGVDEELHFDATASFLRRSARVTPEERRILDLLAVCGRPAEPKVLAKVTGMRVADIREGLRILIDRQMVVAIAGDVELHNLAHDRMRETLYAGLDAGARTEMHLSLARTFAAGLAEADQGERLFEAVGHFHQAETLITSLAERRDVARLYLRAAQATNATGLFAVGVGYLERAKRLLPEQPFELDYDLALAIEHALAASLIPLGRVDESLLAAERIVRNARTVLDEAPGWEARILAYTARNEYAKAIAAGTSICGKLGMPLPRKPTRLGILWRLGPVLWRLRGKTDDELATLPRVDDPRAVRLTRILTSMTGCAYVTEPNLWPVLIGESVTLMLRHGRGPTHALLFAWFGTALAAMGAYEAAGRFARLAIRLMEAPDGFAFLPKLHHAMGQFLSHWTEPLSRSVSWCQSGVALGQRVEDTEFAGYCHMGWAKASLETGEALAEVHKTCVAALETIRASGQKGTELMHLPSLQAVENLLGLASQPSELRGPRYDDEVRVRAGLSNTQNGFRLLEKARLLCFFRKRGGIALSDELIRVMNVGLPATFYFSIARYFACLGWLQECHVGARGWRRLKCLAKVAWSRRSLRRWAASCPESFQHRHLLVEAEWHRAQGHHERAAKAYDDAIAAARRNGFGPDAALAAELAAELSTSRSDDAGALAHLRAALAGYREWGAAAKVNDLVLRYPGLRTEPADPSGYGSDGALRTTN